MKIFCPRQKRKRNAISLSSYVTNRWKIKPPKMTTKSRNTYRHHKLSTIWVSKHICFDTYSRQLQLHRKASQSNFLEVVTQFPLGVEAWYFCFSIAIYYSKIYSLIRKRDTEKKIELNISYLITLQEKYHISYHNIPTNYFSGCFQGTKMKFNFG